MAAPGRYVRPDLQEYKVSNWNRGYSRSGHSFIVRYRLTVASPFRGASKLAFDPCYASMTKPEMRTAIFFTPYRRMKCGRAVLMLCQPPAGPLVGQEVHVKRTSASARTNHRSVFVKPVFLNYIKHTPVKLARERFFNNYSLIWWSEPTEELVSRTP